MAEAGSFAEKVKQQADIVRVIGEYVQLKKAGQNFRGLCPFHSEKTPSFNVHPTKQIYHCFGCGQGGDVFKFVMEMEKCAFPEAIRVVAEKCGIAIPRPKERSTVERFGIGYAPSGGDLLLRHLRGKYPEKTLVESGLVSRDQSGRHFDRFRRRITFPIANESAKIVAFGARALGDDQPKYLNSPETPIYSKSHVLYHLDRAKDALRRADFAVLVEGYMDAIAVARAGISNVVASCGTALAEPQIKLLGRFTKRVIVNYDPDTAGQAATERSLTALLEQDFEVRVLALPPIGDKKADPDLYIREKGADAYLKQVKEAPPYVDYLITRARQMDLTSGEGKLRAVNFLLPYVQKIPNRILRSEWATRIAQQLHLDEPVVRAALSKAASERRGEVKLKPELVRQSAKPAERRLIRMLAEAEGFRRELAQHLQASQLHLGLETEKIFAALIGASVSGEPFHASEVGAKMDDRERRLFFEILFEECQEPAWEEAQSCLDTLARKQIERELTDVQRGIEANPTGPAMRELLTRKQELMRRLAASG